MSTSCRTGPVDGPADPPAPRSGEVLHITQAASAQFRRPIHFRVIRVHDWPTYSGWIWLDGYQLNDVGEAVTRRSIFVQAAGLRRVPGITRPRGRRSGQPTRHTRPA